MIYAIGDIHGRLDLLDRLLGRLVDDMVDQRALVPTLVFLGDYIDRGPDSCGVIDRLIAVSKLVSTVFLRGNHEAMLLDALQRPDMVAGWGRSGGYETMLSYGIVVPRDPGPDECTDLSEALRRDMPGSHRIFYNSLERAFLCGDYAFVHAGVRPGAPFDAQTEDDLIWIREPFLSDKRDHGKVVVHGHTPVRAPEFRPNRIAIDTGAFATGRLSCLALDSTRQRVIST